MAKSRFTVRVGKKDITIRCHKCKGLVFEIPIEPKREDMITCLGCGETGSYGEITDTLDEQILKKKDEIISVLIRGGKPIH
tara:strand:+ start:247 stop:489 length:243 start_codon:yes stop_codon:yes gene_type:complete